MRAATRAISALLIAVYLVACGQPDAGTPPGAEADSKPVIALVMKSLANEFFVTMADGARAHQEDHPDQYQLIVNGIRNEIDLAQQVALIDQMIASNVDAIIVAPADSKAMVPALARAVAAGIVVVNIDNRLDGDILGEYGLEIPFVGPDNFVGAELVGRYIAERMSQQRTAGFQKAIEDAGLKVVAQQSAQWDQTTAVNITSGMLVQNPNLAAIFAANDNMALGAVAAVAQAGKTGQIAVVGFDNISAIQQLIREGSVLATADQHADLLAVYGIEYALQALNSGSALEDKNTPVDLITFDSFE
jgi:ribose transport system substrate-binding protein